MYTKHVTIKNDSDTRRSIRDYQLPGERIFLDPGESTQIPVQVYNRVARRISTWAKRMDKVTVEVEAEIVAEHRCPACDKVCASAIGLKSHMRTHEKEGKQ